MKSQKTLFSFIPQVEVSMVSEVQLLDTNFRCSEDIVKSEIAKNLLKSDREKFICIHLNVKNKIISFEVISTGSLTSSIVHPREVYKGAILSNAANVIFIHNHPSGDPEPSMDDVEITSRLKKAGDLLGINVLDHIIVTKKSFYSFLSSDPYFFRS